MIDLSFALPMTEAADFWRNKLHLSPGEFAALPDEAKVLAFAVSGIAKGEELTTVYTALQDALNKGITFEEWKAQAADVFERRGWTGKKAWRLDTIFRTNIQTAYNVGRYWQMQQVKEDRPYWRYSAVNDSRTRPAHRAMNGKIFPADHPFWNTWYPPNGFRCRCSVNSVSQSNLDANGWQVETKDPTGKLYEPTDPDTGVKLPARLLMPDPGFMSNPAKNFYGHADQVMQDSLSRMEPRIAAKVRKEWEAFQAGRVTLGADSGTGSLIKDTPPENVATYDEQGLAFRAPVQNREDAQKLMQQFARENPDYFEKGPFRGLIFAEDDAIMHTDARGSISVSTRTLTDKENFNPAESLVSALRKIGDKTPLNVQEEYSLEALWHEVLHNRAQEYQGYYRGSAEERVMEALHQITARHDYGKFLKMLGTEPVFRETILAEGYGNRMLVKSARDVMASCGISEADVVGEIRRMVLDKPFGQVVDNFTRLLHERTGDSVTGIERLVYSIRRE